MSAYDDKLTALETRLGYSFIDRELLIRALTHSSYGDGRRKFRDNERLEFLGDRVLGLLTAKMLFEETTSEEGQLARHLNALVKRSTCATVARNLDIGSVLRMSQSEIRQGGREKTSILGDACEAIIAAIYLDGGWLAVETFYLVHWRDQIKAVLGISAKDPKTELQERAVKYNAEMPIYHVEGQTGPDHNPVFNVSVSVKGVGTASGQGHNKKDAERNAAIALLKAWPKVTSGQPT